MWGLVVTAVLAVSPGEAAVDADAVPAPRGFHLINADLRGLIRRESRAEDPSAKAAAIREMCTLYGEIVRDPRLSTSDTLKGYKAKLWSRLTRIKSDLQRQLKRATEAARKGRSPAAVSSPGDQLADVATASLAAHMSLIGYTLGGPGSAFSERGAAGGGAVPPDHGQALVDLIERTLSPQFWDVNGGPGTIVYYAPLRVLVVRATSEMHHDVGGLLGGLRAAGN